MVLYMEEHMQIVRSMYPLKSETWITKHHNDTFAIWLQKEVMANDEIHEQLACWPVVGVYRQACSWIPLAVRFVGRDRLLWNSMVQGTQRVRQVRAACCEIPYVLCGCLYCLRC